MRSGTAKIPHEHPLHLLSWYVELFDGDLVGLAVIGSLGNPKLFLASIVPTDLHSPFAFRLISAPTFPHWELAV